jgi:16S rRNA (uracil1498-N3)-methyltransferase
MNLPFFYTPDLSGETIQLDEDMSKHIVQVLRMKAGAGIQLTDGKGKKAIAEITDDNRKRCKVVVREIHEVPPPFKQVSIAISLVKNTSRFEWFLEKATEVGVCEIIPLICDRTEKEKFRLERMTQIIVSALLQSQQCWLPKLGEPQLFKDIVSNASAGQKLIAHCIEQDKNEITAVKSSASSILLIGPEGDFTNAEIDLALQHQFLPVSLGATRLRTETAGLVGAVLLMHQ